MLSNEIISLVILLIIVQGGYAGVAWSFFTQYYYGGFFVHQWNVRFREFQIILYVCLYPMLYSHFLLC